MRRTTEETQRGEGPALEVSAPPPAPAAKTQARPEKEPAREADRKTARRRLARRVLLALGPLAALVVGGVVYLTGGRYVSTEDAYVKADKAMVAAEVSGLVSQVDVRENQHVEAGDALFRLDDRPYRIALAAAEARLADARTAIESLKAVYAQKQEELALAQADIGFAQREFDRQTALASSSAVSRSALDAAGHALETAKSRKRSVEQELAQVRAQLDGDPSMPVERHPKYLEAAAARDQAALDLEHTVVRAPIAGVAGDTPEPGKQVTGNGPLSSPVMNVVADSGAWIEANFKETDLTYMRPGQPVTIHVDAYPDHAWRGVVDSISQATGAEFAVIPPQNATGNWVKVVQRIPVRVAVTAEPGEPVLRAGMSAEVEIDTGHRRRLPGFAQAALELLGGSPGANAEEAAKP